MKISFLYLSLSMASCLVLCNCTQTLQDRIDRNPAIYSALSGPQQQAVRQGKLLKGMNKDAVYLSWGRPSGVKEISRDGIDFEKWRYTRHLSVVHQDVHVGFGHDHHHGYYGPYYEYGPTIEHIPYTSAVVEFRNGTVSSWERERR